MSTGEILNSESDSGRDIRSDAQYKDLVERVFSDQLLKLRAQTDRTVGCLLLCQWLCAIVCAVWLSPFTWNGPAASMHAHVFASVVIGGLLALFPCAIILAAPGAVATRWIAAIAQMLFSGLLIHIMSGRFEAQFLVFGSLALLAAYKDRWVFLPAVTIVAVDHLLRGAFWPESVFGLVSPAVLRAAEHAVWVLFTTGFLLWGVTQSLSALRRSAELQAFLLQRDQPERRAIPSELGNPSNRIATKPVSPNFISSGLGPVHSHASMHD